MNDRFLRACRREATDRTPLWIMRQAGRYLPEYRELRQRHDFLTVCRTPELAVEVSLQPLRRFPLDAAIVFSDILLPLDAFGIPMTFSPGPKLTDPVRTRAQVEALLARPAAEALSFVGEAVRLLRRELDGRTPVIGFAGAPFTLAAYLAQGEGKEGFGAIKSMIFREPETAELLLGKLTRAMIDYLRLQIGSGAQAVQIFDSWAGILGPRVYFEHKELHGERRRHRRQRHGDGPSAGRRGLGQHQRPDDDESIRTTGGSGHQYTDLN